MADSSNTSNRQRGAVDKDQQERKGGRRATMMVLFAMNAAMVLATFTPLSSVFIWFVEDYPESLDMLHGILWTLWTCANVMGWWAAKMGD